MKRFVQSEDRSQCTLFPECLDDYIAEDNPVRIIDVFVNELDLGKLGFEGSEPKATGRPAYHPSTLLKIYIYGYLNRVQSSRRLERESQRNVELMWLTGRLTPDFKTIAEAGLPGFEVATSSGYLLPARTPHDIVLRLNSEINKALSSAAVSEKFAANGTVIAGGTPEQFAEFLRRETTKWAGVIKAAGIKPQ